MGNKNSSNKSLSNTTTTPKLETKETTFELNYLHQRCQNNPIEYICIHDFDIKHAPQGKELCCAVYWCKRSSSLIVIVYFIIHNSYWYFLLRPDGFETGGSICTSQLPKKYNDRYIFKWTYDLLQHIAEIQSSTDMQQVIRKRSRWIEPYHN